MGGSNSREVRVPIGGAGGGGGGGGGGAGGGGGGADAVHALEEALFKAGYQHGREDALAGVEGEVSRAARAAYGALVLEEEAARASALAASVAALEAAARPGAAGSRAASCTAEEADLLACTPSAANDRCAAPVRAYVSCADRVLFRMMHPAAAAAQDAAAAAAAPALH